MSAILALPRARTPLALLLVLLSLACGSSQEPAPAPPAPAPPEPACCLVDGKPVKGVASDCTKEHPKVDLAVCEPGAAVPPICCAYEDRIYPADDYACSWPEGAPLGVYHEPGDRSGAGWLVAGAQCEAVCCEAADYRAEKTLRGLCTGNVVQREPCVAEYPATRVCCRTEENMDDEGAFNAYSWEPDGSCKRLGDAAEVRPDADCEGIAHGEERWGDPLVNPQAAPARPSSGRPRPTSSTVTKTRPR